MVSSESPETIHTEMPWARSRDTISGALSLSLSPKTKNPLTDAVPGKKDYCRSGGLKSVSPVLEHIRKFQPIVEHQLPGAGDHLAGPCQSDYPQPLPGFERQDLLEFHRPKARSLHDLAGQEMIRFDFRRGDPPQGFIGVCVQCDCFAQNVAAFGQGPCFIENHHVQAVGPFEGGRVADEYAGGARPGDCCDPGKRSGYSESAGACYDEYG